MAVTLAPAQPSVEDQLILDFTRYAQEVAGVRRQVAEKDTPARRDLLNAALARVDDILDFHLILNRRGER